MRTKRRTSTVIALLLLAIQTTAQKVAALDASLRKQVVDSTCAALLRNYVYPEKAILMEKAIRRKLKQGGYNAILEQDELARTLTKDLRAEQADNHLSVRYDPDLEKRIKAFIISREKDKAELKEEQKQNFFFRKAEMLGGNIGYIEFTHFADTNEAARKTAAAALQFVANADALIFDLRNNFGGRVEMAKEIMAHFFNQPQLVSKTFNRITNTWTDEWVGDLHKNAQVSFANTPLYILISERTFSAAEGFAYTLQQLRNAVVVGDTSRGGAHTTRSFALGNGFVGFIPFTRSENVKTKTDWEGVGVIPTCSIKDESALAKAQELILKQRIQTTADSTEIRALRWLLNDLQTQLQPRVVAEKVLGQYTGNFDGFLFTLENGNLYCRNTYQRGKKERLTSINETLFKIDEQSHVQFMMDKNGFVSSIKLFWNDGWVEEVKKTQ